MPYIDPRLEELRKKHKELMRRVKRIEAQLSIDPEDEIPTRANKMDKKSWKNTTPSPRSSKPSK